MLKLIDLIKLAGIELHDFKIHCATPGDDPLTRFPLEAFYAGKFREWQERQGKKNFECEQILSLINLEKDQWLFAGVYVVDERAKPTSTGGYRYSTHEVSGLEHLVGKAIVQFRRPGRQPYLLGAKYKDHLLVAELRSQRMTIGDFPGYKSVLLSYSMLQTVVQEYSSSWRTALSNVAGVYLITDTSDGKAYAQNGHGGNKEIVKLLHEKSNSHAQCFQFSLLEVCDRDTDSDYVIKRETHWKTVLRTREFGLNKN